MFKVNEYYDGKVKSISLTTQDGPATVGVMAKGEYEFSTSSKEFMTVTTGLMKVKLPGASEFRDFKTGDTFIVESGNKFQLIIPEDCSYVCLYQ